MLFMLTNLLIQGQGKCNQIRADGPPIILNSAYKPGFRY